MDYSKKTVIQLKEICKKNKIFGYSKLNKKNLISHIKKNIKKGGNNKNIKIFYEKYKNDNQLYLKLQNYFDNITSSDRYLVEYFIKDELKKLTYFERYILYLNIYYIIFSNSFFLDDSTEYYKVIYKKDDDNHKKNFSKIYKQTSGNIKIIKLKNDIKYINDMILYFNQNTFKSTTGSCTTGIRLRINKIKNEFNTSINHNIFDNEVFCIPFNNPYIEKINNNNKNYKIGANYKKYK